MIVAGKIRAVYLSKATIDRVERLIGFLGAAQTAAGYNQRRWLINQRPLVITSGFANQRDAKKWR